MNENTIVTETELLTDIRFYGYLAKTDFGVTPPIVTNLMADSLSDSARKWLDKAVASGLLKLQMLDIEDVLSIPKAYLSMGLSLGELHSLWYAKQNGLIAIGCSSYWQKIKQKNIRVISHKDPAQLVEALHKINHTTQAAGRRFSRSAKQKQGR